MFPRIKILAFAILSVIATSPAALAQQAESLLVKAEGPTSYEISNRQEEDVIRIPITLQPGVIGVTPKLFSVTLGKRSDQALVQFFTPAMEAITPDVNRVPAFLIKVKTKSLAQGNYDLIIDFTPIAAPAVQVKGTAKKTTAPATPVPAPKHQFLKIEIVLQAATLAAPGVLIVEQVRFPFTWCTPDDPKLALTEISGNKTRLTDVKIVQSAIPTGDNPATNSRLTFDPITEIAPADTGLSGIKLTGAFPIGTTKGTALISSPQLKAPVPVSFEVRTRLWRGFIVLVMIVGLVLGFLTRTWAKQRTELQEARLKAIAVLETLRRELATRPDARFQLTVTAAAEALNTAITSGTALTEAVPNANNALAAALKTLDTDRAAAQTSLSSLNRLVQLRAALPADFAPALEVNSELLDAIAHNIERDDVSAAATTLSQTFKGIARAVGETLPAWSNNTRTFFEQVADLAALLPPTQAAAISGEITTLFADLTKVPVVDETTSADNLLMALIQVRDLHLRFTNVLRRFLDLFASSIHTLQMQFTVKKTDPAAVADLLTKLDQLQKNLLRWSEQPQASQQDLQSAIADATTAWYDALLKQLPGEKAAVVAAATAVKDLLNTNEYWKAAMYVINFLREKQASKDPLFGETGAAVTAPEVAFEFTGEIPFWPPPWTGHDDLTIFSNVREKTLAPAIESLKVSTVWELAWAKRFRFVVSLIVIVLVGYVVFAENFAGTAMDLLAVFVWAFGTDITIDAVMEAGKKVKQPS